MENLLISYGADPLTEDSAACVPMICGKKEGHSQKNTLPLGTRAVIRNRQTACTRRHGTLLLRQLHESGQNLVDVPSCLRRVPKTCLALALPK